MKDIYHLTVEVEAHDQNDFPDEDELANGITEGLPKEWFDDDTDGDRYAVVRIEPWAPGKPLAKARAFLRQEQRLTEHLTGKVEELESTIDDRDRYTLELQADKAVLNESLRMQVEASKVYIGERDHLQQRVDDLVKCNDTQFGIIGSQNARVEENDKLSAQNRTLTIIAQNNGVYINEAKVELDEKRAEIAGLENALIEQRDESRSLEHRLDDALLSWEQKENDLKVCQAANREMTGTKRELRSTASKLKAASGNLDSVLMERTEMLEENRRLKIEAEGYKDLWYNRKGRR